MRIMILPLGDALEHHRFGMGTDSSTLTSECVSRTEPGAVNCRSKVVADGWCEGVIGITGMPHALQQVTGHAAKAAL